MKILLMPNELSDVGKYHDCDGFIIGIKDLSWFIPITADKSELEDYVSKIKKENKQVFIGLNKLMYNSDLSSLRDYLLYIENLDIDGVLYDDLAVYNLAKSLSLTTDLIWFSPHLLTNHFTANYWYNKGIKCGLIGTEIPLDHIIRIKDNTDMKLMMYGYGYLPMFVSSRSLISSYFKYTDMNKTDGLYHMYEETRDSSYPTYEEGNDTIILSSEIINVIEEIPSLSNKIDYLILSSLNIPSDIFDKIYHHYVESMKIFDESKKLKEISNMVNTDSVSKTDKGFLYKETVYRVKDNGEKRSD